MDLFSHRSASLSPENGSLTCILMRPPKVFWVKEIVITLCKIRQLYEFYAWSSCRPSSGRGNRSFSPTLPSSRRHRRNQQRIETSNGSWAIAGSRTAACVQFNLVESGRLEYPACCCLREDAPDRVRKGQCSRILALFYAFDKENCRTNRPERSEKEFFGVPTAIYRVSTILCCGLKQLVWRQV